MTDKRDYTGPYLKNGRSLILAYDQGLEHGPSADFNDNNVDPAFIVDIANKGGYTALALQKGTAEKYYDGKTPLILKLNGKSALVKGEPISRQHCSVKYAEQLGAKAVGYTIFLGSGLESEMVREWGQIQEQAHERGMAAVCWVYPRGTGVPTDTEPDIVAYAARAGLELGADIVKIKYSGDAKTFAWAVKAAGRAKVVMSGGAKTATDEAFLAQVRGVIEAGGAGLAVGRNVWQHPEPLKITEALKKIIFETKAVAPAMSSLTR
jgi:fructose-bisphosphate aldolase, class I